MTHGVAFKSDQKMKPHFNGMHRSDFPQREWARDISAQRTNRWWLILSQATQSWPLLEAPSRPSEKASSHWHPKSKYQILHSRRLVSWTETSWATDKRTTFIRWNKEDVSVIIWHFKRCMMGWLKKIRRIISKRQEALAAILVSRLTCWTFWMTRASSTWAQASRASRQTIQISLQMRHLAYSIKCVTRGLIYPSALFRVSQTALKSVK